MELIFIIAILVIAYFVFKSLTNSFPKESTADQPQPPIINTNKQAIDALTRIATQCQEKGGDGFNSLLLAAMADGKISRDELKIMMWFCEGFGAQFTSEDADYIAALNASVNLRATGDATPVAVIEGIQGYDISQLTRLYAAHTCIGKPWNKTSKRGREILKAIEKLIDESQKPSKGEASTNTE